MSKPECVQSAFRRLLMCWRWKKEKQNSVMYSFTASRCGDGLISSTNVSTVRTISSTSLMWDWCSAAPGWEEGWKLPSLLFPAYFCLLSFTWIHADWCGWGLCVSFTKQLDSFQCFDWLWCKTNVQHESRKEFIGRHMPFDRLLLQDEITSSTRANPSEFVSAFSLKPTYIWWEDK